MLFSRMFEIGLLILGFLYIADLYLDSIIDLIQVSNDIEKNEQEKREDDDLKKLTKHLYS